MRVPSVRQPVRIRLAGVNRAAQGDTLDPSSSRSNYLRGSDRSLWRTNVAAFGRIRYREIYPGTDIIYYGNDGQLEFDFHVAAGADPRHIRMSFEGVERVAMDSNGDLLMRTSAGELRQHRPRVYQVLSSGRREIAGRYVMHGRRSVGVQVDAYDPHRELVIDPLLSYATYAGGSRTDSGYGVAVDGAGNMYVAGRTYSVDFPATPEAFQKTNSAPWDLFITKLDTKGGVVYSTYLGGKSNEVPSGIGVDRAGNVWVGGYTDSVDFPMTAKSYQGSNRGGYYGFDAFLAKLDATGSNLLYSTYLGGNNDDLLMGLTVDAQGAVYATGLSASNNFPTSVGAYQKSNLYVNAFVVKFNAEGNMVYSTFVGGTKSEVPGGIAVDAAGNAYVVGDTNSQDFPTTSGAIQPTLRGGTDVFLFKLNSAGSQLLYSTFFGGTDSDTGYGVAADASGNAYICGKTASSNFPLTANPMKRDLTGPTDAFVAKVDTVAGKLVFSTLLGGSREETALAIAADDGGNSYVGGWTTSTNFPTLAPFQVSHGGGSDGFIVKLDPTGSKVLDGSLLGGSGDETIYALAFDGAATVYVAGDTSSTDFPVTRVNATQKTYGGGNSDAFVAKVTFAIEQFKLVVAPEKLLVESVVAGPVKHLALGISTQATVNPAWTAEAAAAGGNWLSVTPKSGTGGGTLDVAVDPGTLAAGTYAGSISVVNQVTSARIVIPVTLTVSIPPGRIAQNGVVNAASGQGGAVAPGEMVVVKGTGIGPDKPLDTTATGEVLPVVAGETRVLFDGVAAALMQVSATSAGVIVPYEVAGKDSTVVEVEYRGVKSNALSLPVAACAPGIYTVDPSGKGQARAYSENGTGNSPDNPAAKGSVLTLYATGEGQTDPPGVNGKIAGGVLPKPLLPVALRIGGQDAELLYFGAAPNSAGILQLNARIPVDMPSGDQAVVLTVGDCSSQADVTVSVQ